MQSCCTLFIRVFLVKYENLGASVSVQCKVFENNWKPHIQLVRRSTVYVSISPACLPPPCSRIYEVHGGCGAAHRSCTPWACSPPSFPAWTPWSDTGLSPGILIQFREASKQKIKKVLNFPHQLLTPLPIKSVKKNLYISGQIRSFPNYFIISVENTKEFTPPPKNGGKFHTLFSFLF